MRPQQQNRRMRGRNNNGGGGGNNNNNNNRKGPNPLTRNYESNGPDVKIRGSAQQIAEKYATLARDAQSSGDRVMAENYLQHAEHYNRIIAAAQAQMPIQNAQQNRDDFEDDEDRDDFDNAGNGNGGETQAPLANPGNGPQPTIEGTPAELAYGQENSRENNNGRDNNGRNNNGRDNNGRNRDRRPGGYGQNEPRGDFAQRGEQNGQRGDQQRFNETPAQGETVAAAEPAAETGFSEPAPLYENLSPAALAARAELNEAAADSGAARRPRRPRRPRTNADHVSDNQSGGEADSASETAAATEVVDAAPAESPAGDPFVVDANN
ncbi:DUF4167 domain-containing protein [Mesorhizobium sp. ArgA1]